MKNDQHIPQGTAGAGTFSPLRRPFRQRGGLLALCLLLSPFAHLRAQSVDKRYHVYPIGASTLTTSDPETYDYCITPKADGNGYVAVSATRDNPSGAANQWCIKLVECDDTGGFVNSSRYIHPQPAQLQQLVPLKVITLNGGNGYAITGYHLQEFENCPMPFVVKLDNNYSIIDARLFYTCGFFTDVDEMPNGCFIFSGSWSDNTNITAVRQAAIMKTDASFVPVFARSIEKMPIGTAVDEFDIVHDLVVVDDDSAYFTGSVTDVCSTTPTTTTTGYMLLGEVNLNTGLFNWTNNCINSLHFIGSRIAVNENYIAVALNASTNNASNIAFFDRATKAFITRYIIEHNPTIINQGTLNTHIPFIQNLYFEDQQTVFFSGKQVGLQLNGNPATHFEMPFSGELDINGNAANGRLFLTDQDYLLPTDFLSYRNNHTSFCNSTPNAYFPIWAASNTLPQNGQTGNFVTITHDNLNGNLFNKTWMFTHDNQMCGYVPLDFNILQQSADTPFSVINQSKSLPPVLELAMENKPLHKEFYECDQNPN